MEKRMATKVIIQGLEFLRTCELWDYADVVQVQAKRYGTVRYGTCESEMVKDNEMRE